MCELNHLFLREINKGGFLLHIGPFKSAILSLTFMETLTYTSKSDCCHKIRVVFCSHRIPQIQFLNNYVHKDNLLLMTEKINRYHFISKVSLIILFC